MRRFWLTSWKLIRPSSFFGGISYLDPQRPTRVLGFASIWLFVWGLLVIVPAILIHALEARGLISWSTKYHGGHGPEQDLPRQAVELMVIVAVMLIAQLFTAVGMFESRLSPSLFGVEVFRLLAYGVSGIAVLQAMAMAAIWASAIIFSCIASLIALAAIGALGVWGVVYLLTWWPAVLSGYLHTPGRGSLKWLPMGLGLLSGLIAMLLLSVL